MEAAMADEADNVEILKSAYQSWSDTRGASAEGWLKICDDNIAFGSLAQGSAPRAQYMTSYSSRDALTEYFSGLARDWEMLDWKVDNFIAQDDRVVVLSRCTWRFKANGKVVSTPKADVWRLVNGKAVEFFEFYDTAQVHAAVA
jgi:ketosteroid isomerase-like protein